MDEIEKLNRKKYLRAPSYEEIRLVLKKCHVKGAQFERFFGMSPCTISKIKRGDRELPARYWHYIYEKRMPEYIKLFRGANMAGSLAVTVSEIFATLTPSKQAELVSMIRSMQVESLLTPEMKAVEQRQNSTVIEHDALSKLKRK